MRTSLLTMAFILPIAVLPSCATKPAISMSSQADVAEVEEARRAFLFAFPLYEMMRVRKVMLARSGARVNLLRHRSALSSPSDREVTAPNNDTLYSSAWLDLATGPILFEIPVMGDRYHSVELMHSFTDAFDVLGSHENSGRGGRYLIVGPDWIGTADPGATVVRAPTNDVWLIARTLVNGKDDLAAARKLQAAYKVTPSADPSLSRNFDYEIPQIPQAEQFLSVVNSALARGGLPQDQAGRLGGLAEAGLLPGASDAWSNLSPAMQRAWTENMERFYQETETAFIKAGVRRNGWRYPSPGLAEYGDDDEYRSAVALSGLAALPLSEATYVMTTVDGAGNALDGGSEYKLHLPSEIPVDGFWSLTLYESDGTGRWFLFDNELDRYSIGNRTGGLTREADGSLVITVSHHSPAGGANWLPAPEGRFRLNFRAYRPRPSLINGEFLLPPLKRIE